ncbi:MAG: phage tail length tape measure family protein [Xylophilus sp.]|nr:phage tail length tape measure family protein [Xylophilus sp.]
MTVSTHKAQLEIGADGSQAINEFGRVQAASGKMAEGVKKAGTEAGAGLENIGKGSEESAAKMTRAERSIVSSIQRVTAQAQAAGKQSAAFENLIDLRGLDRAKFEPYLQGLRQAELQTQSLGKGLRQAEVQTQSLGNTAKQTAASLRMVPAQLTDIVVSLQGGQAPMTVLLQQGGQLKDMFGGIGPAARALGGYVMGMVNPFTAAAAAGAALAVAAYQGAQESKAFTDTLITTGNQAGVTAGRLMLMAQSLDSVAGTQGNAAAVLNQLAATGQVTAAGLQLAAQAAIEFERAGGQAAEKTVAGFAELGKAPLAATIKLNESMGYLTRSTYEQIKSLEEQGRTADAAALAQKAFADALLTRAPEMLANMGYLETRWFNIKDAVKEAWDGIKNIGRDAGVEGQSASVNAAIARLEGVIRTKAQGGYNTQMFDAELAKLKERQSILQSDERLLRSAADNQAQQTREVEARVKWDKEGAQYLDKKVKMEREITQAISDGTKAKATQAEIDARVAAIREKYKEKAGPKTSFVPGSDNAREWETYMKAFGAAAVDAEGKVSGLTKTQGKLIEYLGSGAYLNMPEPARQTALQAAYAAIATEQQVEATKHQAQAWTEANKAALAYGKQLDDMALAGADLIAQATSYAAAIDQQVAATEFEASLIGQSNVQRGIALKQYQIELETKKEIARINATLASQADRDAAIGAVKAAGDRAKASAAAEVVNQEFNRVSAQIEQSLTDALMRGFESGKGFAETLRDTVANMFKTLVLRPIVSAVVNPMAGAITAGLGLPGAASAATTGANAMSGMGMLGGSLGALGTGLGAGAGMIAGGGVGGWLTASTSLIGTGTAAGAAAGIGALAGPIGAALAVASLLKGLDDSGTMHTGGLGSYSAARGSSTGDAVKAQGLGFDLSSNDYNAATAQASVAIAQAVAGMLDSTAATFGQKAGYFAATAWADDTSDDGGWGALMVKLGDQVLLDWKNGTDKWPGREFSDGEAGAKEYAAAVAKDVRDYLITQTPAWADTMLTALGDAPSLEQLAATVGQINATATALDGMGQASAAFAGMAEGTTSALIAAMGGAEAAVASLSGYYTNFYTESERTAVATATLTGQLGELGQAMPASREAFRALVDAAVAAGDTTLAAGLVNLQDEFAALVPAANDAATAVSGVLSSLEADTKRLQRQLIEAQGGDLTAFDTDGMTIAERAVYALNQSLQAQIDATNAAKSATDTLADTQQQAADTSQQAAADTISAWQDAQRSMAQGWLDGAQSLQTARYEYAQRELDAARAAETAIATARTSAAQASIEAVSGIAGALRSAREALTGAASQPLTTTSYGAARGLIDQAATTGNLGAAGLEDALKIVSGNTQSLFGRFEDWAMAQAAAAAPVAKLDAQAQGQMAAAQAIIATMKAQEDEAALRYDENKRVLGDNHNALMDSLQMQYDAQIAQIEATNAVGVRFDSAVAAMTAAAAGGGGGGGGGVTMPDFSGLTDAIRQMATSFNLSYEQAAALVQKGAAPTAQNGNTTFVMSDGTALTAPTGSADAAKYQDMWDTSMRLRRELEQQTGAYFFNGLEGEVATHKKLIDPTGNWNPNITATDFLNGLKSRGVDTSKIGRGTQADLYKYLEQYGIKPYATGINLVPNDQLAYIHKGEAVVPAAFNPFNPNASRPMSSDNAELVVELRALRAELQAIRAATTATAGFTAGTDRQLRRVIRSDAITTETV